MKTLDIKDLSFKGKTEATANDATRTLSRDELKRVQGGRKIAVLVDGRPGGVIDDFQLNMEIFKGNIGVKVV
jgi:hypothetical protein